MGRLDRPVYPFFAFVVSYLERSVFMPRLSLYFLSFFFLFL